MQSTQSMHTAVAQIRPGAFSAWATAQAQEDGVPVVVLDVRETWEFNTARLHPQSAAFDVLSIPMQELPQRLAELPQNRAMACLCHHGIRSQRVALFLHQNGFEMVVNIAGGIEAWSAEDDSSVPHY